MWELNRKEGWALKNGCFQTMVLEKTLESPLDYKEIKPVNRKGNQSWIVTGRTDAEAEAPILCPPDAKSQLTAKDPDAVKDWGQEEKGVTEDEMVGWHHLLNGREFEKAPGDSKGQRSLACCGPQGHRVRHNLANKQQLCSCWPFCKSGTRQKGTTCRDSKAQLSYLSFIVYMCVCVCVCVCVCGRGGGRRAVGSTIKRARERQDRVFPGGSNC